MNKLTSPGNRANKTPNEGCIYFELPNGQVSFHCDEELKKYCIVEKHKWIGLTNSRDIINEYFNKERIF
jgi:hypothetical protein